MKTLIETVSFPEPSIIAINGIELEVFEAGSENIGNPIVLCHGFPEHAFSWRYQIPALVEAGYHVIVPNQRGYGNSSSPNEIAAYDITCLTDDLVALLEYYNYTKATFIGHDWGANVVWHLALLHPKRVHKVINLALPYQERGDRPWLERMEEFLGEDFYFVHFNKQPGVADEVMERNTDNLMRNLFRKNVPLLPPTPGMLMLNLAQSKKPLGEPLMSDAELKVFISSFEASGFSGAINWYRNLDRNWSAMANVKPRMEHPSLMIYGEKDVVPKSQTLKDLAPNLDVISLDCGHHIQQEKPKETNKVILSWLANQSNYML